MNIKRLIIGTATGALLMGVFSFSTFAAPKLHLDSRGQLNKQACDVEGNLVINIVEKVLNSPDGAADSHIWAMDNYTRLIKVWPTGVNTWCATVKYEGEFNAAPGVVSPGGTNIIGVGVQGTLKGGYNATFTGNLISPVFGDVGTTDYQCKIDDLSLCRYENWVDKYFLNSAEFSRPWIGWIYNANNNHGSWLNEGSDAGLETTGDIY